MEHQHALAQAMGPHFKRRAVRREGVLAGLPCVDLLWCGIGLVVLAIVEHDFEVPVAVARRLRPRLAGLKFGQIRYVIAVENALEIAIGGTPWVLLVATILLVGLRKINVFGVLRFVVIRNDVALVVVALADEPAEDTFRISGSAIRELSLSLLPYQVVMLSFEMERQKISSGLAAFVHRSMWANRPSTRGR